MSCEPVGYAILGCGNIAGRHAQSLAALSEARLVAAADPLRERACALAERYDARPETSVEALAGADDIEAVVISAPAPLHAALASKLIASGKHVLIEKPIDTDPTAARALVARAHPRHAILSVVSQHRFGLDVGWLRDRVRDGALGRPISIVASSLWSRDQHYYEAAPGRGRSDASEGGVLLNQAVHTIDLLLWIFGPARSLSASCATLTHRIAVEDNACIQVRLESGALATLIASTSVFPQASERFEVHFEHGAVVLEKGRVVMLQSRPDRPLPPLPSHSAPAETDRLEGFRLQHLDFIAAVRGDREPLVTGPEACAVTELVAAAYASARDARSVDLDSSCGSPSE
ncbi:MAG: Gfo/Idh/MocA family protein [Myxococcota bacterium]